jgi:hypothetical protein
VRLEGAVHDDLAARRPWASRVHRLPYLAGGNMDDPAQLVDVVVVQRENLAGRIAISPIVRITPSRIRPYLSVRPEWPALGEDLDGLIEPRLRPQHAPFKTA